MGILSKVATVGSGGTSLLGKLGLYALLAIILMGIGSAGGYKAGVILQEKRDKDRIDSLVTKLTEKERELVTQAKAGQDALTDALSKNDELKTTSAEARDEILKKLTAANAKLAAAGSGKFGPVADSGVLKCGISADISKIVNQLLEQSNATNLYSVSSKLSGLWFDPYQGAGSFGSILRDEVLDDTQSATGEMCRAPDGGSTSLL